MSKSLTHLGSLLTFIALIFAPSCMYDRSVLKRVPHFGTKQTIVQANNNVTLSVHPLSTQESEKYFGTDLISQGYFPFMLHIENHTNKKYILEPSYITAELAPPKHIAKLLHYDTSRHMTYSNIFALLFAWPLIPFCILPTGYSMYKTNQKTTKYIVRNSIGPRDRLKVPPYAHIDRFFYLHENDFQTRFIIKLCEKGPEHQLLRFAVNLNERIKFSDC